MFGFPTSLRLDINDQNNRKNELLKSLERHTYDCDNNKVTFKIVRI